MYNIMLRNNISLDTDIIYCGENIIVVWGGNILIDFLPYISKGYIVAITENC